MLTLCIEQRKSSYSLYLCIYQPCTGHLRSGSGSHDDHLFFFFLFLSFLLSSANHTAAAELLATASFVALLGSSPAFLENASVRRRHIPTRGLLPGDRIDREIRSYLATCAHSEEMEDSSSMCELWERPTARPRRESIRHNRRPPLPRRLSSI